MSTEFFTATNSNPNIVVPELGLYDTDSPVSFFVALNQVDPLINENWVITRHNYKGDLIENNISWRDIYLSGTGHQLALLFGAEE